MLAILIATLLPLGPIARGVLVLMSVSPGAPLMINKARSGSGNVTLAVAVAVALTLAALVTLPIELFVLNALFPLHLRASVSTLIWTLIPRLIIPLAVGAGVRHLWPKGADVLGRVVRVLFLMVLALVAISALAVTWPVLGRIGPWGWLAMVLVTAGAAALGELVGGGPYGACIWTNGAAIQVDPDTTALKRATGGAIGRAVAMTTAAAVDWRFRGDIAEIIVYDSALSDGDWSLVRGYLKAHWNY